MSLRQLFLEASANLLSFSESAQNLAQASLLMVETLEDDGFGAAVLTGPKTVLTVAHNFDHCSPKKSVIHRPHTGEKSRVEKAKLYPEFDLAVLTTSKAFIGPFAEIDDVTAPRPGLPIMLPRFFHPRHKDVLKVGSEFNFLKKMKKGLLLDPETTVEYRGEGRKMEASLMHLRSVSGDSGAGIFSGTGALMTILRTGNGFGASGPSIPKFRQLARQHGVRSLSNG
jgi:hypothetical protein